MADYQAKVIAKSDINAWVRALMANAQVVAPVAAHLDDVVYQPIGAPEEIAWDYENTIQPPKTFLFPQVETIYRFQRNGDRSIDGRRFHPLEVLKSQDLFGDATNFVVDLTPACFGALAVPRLARHNQNRH